MKEIRSLSTRMTALTFPVHNIYLSAPWNGKTFPFQGFVLGKRASADVSLSRCTPGGSGPVFSFADFHFFAEYRAVIMPVRNPAGHFLFIMPLLLTVHHSFPFVIAEKIPLSASLFFAGWKTPFSQGTVLCRSCLCFIFVWFSRLIGSFPFFQQAISFAGRKVGR